MTSRRAFITGTVALAAAATLPSRASAAAPALPAGLIYTRENPGKWAGKADSHAPMVTVEGRTVRVETNHKMSEQHYIVRHTLVSEAGEELAEKTFYPSDEPISEFTLPEGASGRIYATSFCNKHDMWVSEFNV